MTRTKVVAEGTWGSFAHLSAWAEATGPCGGDQGHGGEASLELTDEGGMVWTLTFTDEDGREHHIKQPRSVRIEVGGDDEQHNMNEAMHLFISVLDRASLPSRPDYATLRSLASDPE